MTWPDDHEYESVHVAEARKEAKGCVVTDERGWSLWWDCEHVPTVGDTARYYGRGIGFDVRGIVWFPKQELPHTKAGAIIVRYQSPEDHEAERKARSEAYQREFDARVKRPAVASHGRVYDSEMGEISGFGGGYEETCRKMALAGMQWFDEHPDADPKFHGYRGITGVISEDNDDAKALTDAIMAASGGDCTGAMHQACVSHALAYKRLGWDGYRAEMLKREEEPA